MKIVFHYTYLLIIISFILTGYFPNLLIFTSIIIIHELGHYTVAKMLKLNPQKIIIYPFGGVTTMNNPINTSINKELFVSISGILFQTMYYLIIIFFYKKSILREYIFNIFNNYYYNILIFNILPIHPLDGSKFLTLFLSKIIPYKKAMKLNIIISILIGIIILYINYYEFNYTTIMIIFIIIDNLIKYYKNINYIFNKFLLERYLHKLHFKKTKKISKISNMHKDKYHIIKQDNGYLTEKQLLIRRFNEK